MGKHPTNNADRHCFLPFRLPEMVCTAWATSCPPYGCRFGGQKYAPTTLIGVDDLWILQKIPPYWAVGVLYCQTISKLKCLWRVLLYY
ncbi:MAG: hypothetical protein IJV56_05705 [Neisseriaceae bacterium]|nr:hypothetical protein [Neisseriaceae bacterium]MBQ9724822.1 hypothetical protein [Neisseriaceae bacterium]